MTESEAKTLMEIEKECINRDCDRDCANCDIVQKVEDLNNAYDMAINALEKQEKIKKVLDTTCLSDDITKCYYDGDCRLHERMEIMKIVMSDEE